MKKQIVSISFLISFSVCIHAQDAGFSNSNASPVFLNPSFAGSNGLLRSNISFFGYNSRYLTVFNRGASVDAFIKPLKGGVAVSFQNVGVHSFFTKKLAEAAYAQYINFDNIHLIVVPSIQAGYGQNSVDPYAFNWNTPTGSHRTTSNYFNLNTGLIINYRENFYAGLNLMHVNHPEAGIKEPSQLPTHLIFHSSYTFNLSEKNILQVMFRHDSQQSFTRNQLSVNTILCKYLILGAGYSDANEFQVIAGGRLNCFALQIGYNAINSKLNDNTFKTYEVHFSYNLRKKDIRNDVPLFEKM